MAYPDPDQCPECGTNDNWVVFSMGEEVETPEDYGSSYWYLLELTEETQVSCDNCLFVGRWSGTEIVPKEEVKSTTVVYANGHDAFDDDAWYIDGKLVGRGSQINITYDVFPFINGKVVSFMEVPIPEGMDPDYFMWPETVDELLEEIHEYLNS